MQVIEHTEPIEMTSIVTKDDNGNAGKRIELLKDCSIVGIISTVYNPSISCCTTGIDERKGIILYVTETELQVLEEQAKLANLPVEDKYFRYPLQFRQPIMDITLSKILTWFHPVICPLTNRIMHMDKTGFLWPCIGCTRPSSMSHCMYCKMSNHYRDPEFMLKIDPEDDPKIPLQYVTAYKDCNYLDLKRTASQLISMVTKSCGGITFDIVAEYGEKISTDNVDQVITTDELSQTYLSQDKLSQEHHNEDKDNNAIISNEPVVDASFIIIPKGVGPVIDTIDMIQTTDTMKCINSPKCVRIQPPRLPKQCVQQ